MNNIKFIVGWTDSYGSPYKQSEFTQEKRKALIERIRQRSYNFTYDNHQFLPYCAPLYNDGTICVLTKPQFDSVMSESYKDRPISARLIPMDIITRNPVNGILFEKEKYEEEWKNKNV